MPAVCNEHNYCSDRVLTIVVNYRKSQTIQTAETRKKTSCGSIVVCQEISALLRKILEPSVVQRRMPFQIVFFGPGGDVWRRRGE